MLCTRKREHVCTGTMQGGNDTTRYMIFCEFTCFFNVFQAEGWWERHRQTSSRRLGYYSTHWNPIKTYKLCRIRQLRQEKRRKENTHENKLYQDSGYLYQILFTIVYRVRSSNFTLPFFFPESPALFSPISEVRGMSSRSLSNNVFSFLLYCWIVRK